MAQSHAVLRVVVGSRVQSGGGQNCGSPVPPHPNPLPQERESAGTAREFEYCSCSPRFVVFRFGSTRQPSSDVLPKDGQMFLPLLGERVGVRGNEANSNPKRTPTPGTSRVPRQSRGFPNLIMTDHRNRTTRGTGAAVPPRVVTDSLCLGQ